MPSSSRRNILAATGFFAACFGISAIGGYVTSLSVGTWYQTLEKPSFNPPDWLFAPVWTALYLMIAAAGWRVWRVAGFKAATPAFTAYALQLGLNLGWSCVFFGLQLIGLALVELVTLLAAILVNIALFWRQDRFAGVLLLPYVAWVSFAGVLNLAIWRLN